MGAVAGEKANDIKYLSITELNRLLDKTLEMGVGQVPFQGEISQITRAASGHLYFTIKDEESQVSAVMWRGVASALSFQPDAGKAVLCHAQPNVYHKSGKLQMIVHKMLPAGEGDLQRKFLELKAKLEKEGLFAPGRKRPLPFLPGAVGLVTSRSGAVVHDIMIKFNERMPQTKVYLVDVRVQGDGAAKDIAEGIERLNASGAVDLIIVARGGGSLQDLWAFNEEPVVRAIFGSQVPVISGVGHEVDVTLSDLAADARAPTPTAAAEMAVPKRADLLAQIAEFERRLRDFDRWFAPMAQSVDELGARIDQLMRTMLAECRLHLRTAEAKLKTLRPENALSILKARLEALGARLGVSLKERSAAGRARLELAQSKLIGAAAAVLKEAEFRLDRLNVRLESISPKKVMERGFSIVHCDGKIISSSHQVKIEDHIQISFAKGGVKASVLEKI